MKPVPRLASLARRLRARTGGTHLRTRRSSDTPGHSTGMRATVSVVLVGMLAFAASLVGGRPALAVSAAVATVACCGLALALPAAVASLRETLRHTRRLGDAPRLVGRLVIRMRVDPSVERAASFAAAGEGPLACDLAAHVRRARGTPEGGLASFAAAWRRDAPALRRACLLAAAAGDVPAARRDSLLDRATRAVREGTTERARAFAADLEGPTNAVYAFGVLLPLALVAVAPAAGVAGAGVTLELLVVGYDLLLPAALLGASAWLLARRPVVFPAAALDDHPALPDRPWPAVGVGVAAAVLAWVVAGTALPAWTRPLAAVGGAGVGLAVHFRPARRVRERVRAFEVGLSDALYLVGRRVQHGTSVERAVAETAADLDGPVAAAFGAAARRGRLLGLDVDRSFTGGGGPLATLPSERARDAADLLAVAAREGRHAGAAVVAVADHLDELAAVEREAAQSVARVTATLRHTAAVFAPLVGGVTVALADGIGTGGAFASAPATAGLGLAVGAYVLWAAVVLTALATGLECGLDRAVVGYRVGLVLPTATTCYLTAFAAGVLVT